MSDQRNCRGKHDDCLENDSQKHKNRALSLSQKILQTSKAVSDECNYALNASCQGGGVVVDSGETPHALTTNGACGFDKDWSPPERRRGDPHESNLKTKRSLGLKGGQRDYFPSGHSTQRDPSEDDFESIHIGIHPSFLARHSAEYCDSCGPFNDLEVLSDIHSMQHRSKYVPERNYLPLPSSSTFPEYPDLKKCYAGDHSTYNIPIGSPPQKKLSPDGYQPQESSLNLFLMPKTVPAKTLKLPPSSSLSNNGLKANIPLTVTQLTDDIQARNSPNISTDVNILAGRPTFASQFETANDGLGILPDGKSAVAGLGLLDSNSNTFSDESLAALERRVAEACSLVERTLKERQERGKALKETEQKRKEERTRQEQQARERKEREAKETREREHRNERVEGNARSDGGETPSQDSAVAEDRQWLCEHYQRLCRVKFPCCGKFFPCHRCHNNSGCPNDNSKAREACYVECSVCSHQQEINQDAHTCARCRTRFSAYFCSVCKHFTGEDKAPYHCKKCGICRIYKDRSFHCDVCNVCLDKRLEGRHSCRENSGHDECCICLEDAFSGCQILPCSHKVHRECAIAMIQNGVRSCPICRHPLYSPTSGNE
ncbi:uncharacterized protein LOC111336040 [Stylophora pistillata]|uniref:uncharacterized protein LOC111336040 n=1 Tax=Stylophora pistillata TaxID=50429 RepID=UPI000C04DB27|nr:uncharacterized protein LOC111336040 [Stylophora pistillata]XP_022797790.1 uncharacterized protein LOC111336040 [Stylophora pistillata]XP_022797791.1 uncharacterized protein LOC111336040 [Stylophora pistillata]